MFVVKDKNIFQNESECSNPLLRQYNNNDDIKQIKSIQKEILYKLDYLLIKLNIKDLCLSMSNEINISYISNINNKKDNTTLSSKKKKLNLKFNLEHTNYKKSDSNIETNILTTPDNFLNKKFFEEDTKKDEKTINTDINVNILETKENNIINKSNYNSNHFYSQNDTEIKELKNNDAFNNKYNKTSLNTSQISSSGVDNNNRNNSNNKNKHKHNKIKGFNFKNKIDNYNSSFSYRKGSFDDKCYMPLTNQRNNFIEKTSINLLENKPQIMNDKNHLLKEFCNFRGESQKNNINHFMCKLSN